MGKYKVIKSDEGGWFSVWGPDDRIIIGSLLNLEQAKVWIERDRARIRIPVVAPGTVVHEEEA